jgi:hypothetical protein
MSRRQGRGDYHGANTYIRRGGHGSVKLAPDLGQPKSETTVTPRMSEAQTKSDKLHDKLAKKRASRRAWFNATKS